MNEPYLLPNEKGKYDLRRILDDKRILRNPHKGWYVHYVDNGFCRPIYRDGIAPGDYLEDFPGFNHHYLRVDWADIEPEEGKFDWKPLDDIFAEWGEHDCRFTFRFCCYETSTSYATPRWVRDAGADGTLIPVAKPADSKIKAASEPKWEPDYGDPIFLCKLDRFLGELAKKYDGHPLVEFIDVGTFGTWGEGHTGFGSGKRYPLEVIKKHIELHLKHFRKTTLMLNDDIFSSVANAAGIEAAHELADYCAAKGMGGRDDSICVDYNAKTFGYDTLKSPQFFDKFYETAPIDIEIHHFHMAGEEILAGGYPFLEALKRSHATYAGFHGYPRPWLEKYPYFTAYAANRLGYWYFPVKIELNECVSGMYTIAKLHIENRGFARAYNSFTLSVRAIGEQGSFELFRGDGLNLGWAEGECSTERLKLDFAGVPAGEYELCIGLFEGDRPIETGVKAELYKDGYAHLIKFNVTALD